MSKFNSKGLLESSIEIILVLFQFLIIFFHFIKLEFLHNIEIIRGNYIFSFLGFMMIIIASIIMLFAIINLGSNISPFPRPIANGKLITSGIYRFIRHPMYYSLILISLGLSLIHI